MSNIVLSGSYGIELYIKGEFDYYRLKCLYKPKQSDYNVNRIYSSESVETQNIFEFKLTSKVGTVGATHDNPSELSYDELFTTDLETNYTGSEIYIKNGSPIHLYLIHMGYDSFINVKKPYLYFGKLYPKNRTNNIICIDTYFMKDYVIDALPENQRTDNLREFFGVAFDELYSQVYYKMRNILSLSDPWETKDEYLLYLLKTFGTTSILPTDSNEYNLDRFFIQNLPSLLKRKGTYEVFYGIFRFLTNTLNRLNIYEQWHELLPSIEQGTYSSIKEYCDVNNYKWQEHLYDDYYSTIPVSAGAGQRYYDNENEYPISWDINTPTDLRLSPHYRVEIDLSTQPFKSNKILDRGIYNVIIDKFEELRPVSKFVDGYNSVIKIPSDFTGKNIDTYQGVYKSYCRTKCLTPLYELLDNNFIYSNKILTETLFTIYHGLNSRDIIIQSFKYDETLPYYKFIPKEVKILDDDSISFEINEPTKFYIFISKTNPPDTSIIIDTSSTNPFEITGSFDNTNVISLYEKQIDEYKYEFYPAGHTISPPASGFVHYMDAPMVSGNSYEYNEVSLNEDYYTLSTGSLVYTVTHNLNTPAVMVEVYEIFVDGHQEKIIPKNIKVIDKHNVEIEVYDSTKLYITSVKKIGTKPFINTMDDIVFDISYIKLGDGLNTNTWNPQSSINGVLKNEVDGSFYDIDDIITYNRGINGYETFNIKVVLNILNDINITEIGLFNNSDKMYYYTHCSPIEVIQNTKLILYYELTTKTL
jgi:hypothetical protein